MVSMYKIKDKKMELNDILKYISENSKGKIKDSIKPILNENNVICGREYLVNKKYGIVEKFTFILKDENMYFSHHYENPNQYIDLNDSDDIDNL